MDRDLARVYQEALAREPVQEASNRLGERRLPPHEIIWSPQEIDLENQYLQFLLSYWRALPRVGDLPLAASVDPLQMGPALGNIVVSEVLDDGWDYRFRLFGSRIVDRFGKDLIGQRMSEAEFRSETKAFLIAVYLCVISKREAAFTAHIMREHPALLTWWRIILPLQNESGAVSRFLVGVVPVPRRLPSN